MKPFITSIRFSSPPFIHPLHRAVPLLFTLAFLPVILRLGLRDFAVTHPFAAAGPVAAGFWLASSLRELRVSFAMLGAMLAATLWLINWLMLAGGTCCTPN